QAPQAAATRAAALLVGFDFPAFDRQPPLGWLRAERPDVAVARAVELLRPAWRPAPGVHPTASIHPSVSLGPGCHVGAFVAIGEGCRIGADAILHPHAVLYPGVVAGARLIAHAHVVIREGTRLGDDVILQPGVVLGGDGFGFVRRPDGSYAKIPQVGIVSIGDRVEIQSNSCVDRASLDATRVGDGVKVDNLVQIAHNCELADNVLLCSQVGLAGSTRIESGALLAGQVGVAGHCTVGRETVITAQSGTHGDLEAGKMYSGSPAFDHAQWLRATAAFVRLGDLQREVRELRQKVVRLDPGKS
ncbi:MAG: UDP-3-O-(3-hydroxymyristoyl)glucosamine N-acyltransferase, partial [Terriglobales bacterium]